MGSGQEIRAAQVLQCSISAAFIFCLQCLTVFPEATTVLAF